MPFDEINSANLEGYDTGKKRKGKARAKYPSRDYVKVSKRAKVKKKRSFPKKSVIKM